MIDALDTTHFKIPLLIIYMSAIETFICSTEIEVKWVYFLRFCTKYLTRVSKYDTELILALSSTNATKIILFHFAKHQVFVQ